MAVMIQLNDSLAHRLQQLSKTLHKDVDELVNEALQDWIGKKERDPERLLQTVEILFESGDPSFEGFETYREGLLPPRENVFGNS